MREFHSKLLSNKYGFLVIFNNFCFCLFDKESSTWFITLNFTMKKERKTQVKNNSIVDDEQIL